MVRVDMMNIMAVPAPVSPLLKQFLHFCQQRECGVKANILQQRPARPSCPAETVNLQMDSSSFYRLEIFSAQ